MPRVSGAAFEMISSAGTSCSLTQASAKPHSSAVTISATSWSQPVPQSMSGRRLLEKSPNCIGCRSLLARGLGLDLGEGGHLFGRTPAEAALGRDGEVLEELRSRVHPPARALDAVGVVH